MVKLLAKWALSACALLLVAYLYSGVELRGYGAALLAAFVIGLLNAVVRPPLLTLGLFLFVINAAVFWLAAAMLDGFQVRGFGAALLGSLMYTAAGMVIESALESLFAKK